jgi:mitochondrial fission protein ELM1
MPQVNEKKPVLWIVTEGLTGTENQCLAVAQALNIEPVVKRIDLRQPWNLLSPWLAFEMASTFSPRLEGPWPDILIASGRKAIAASRYIKKQSSGKTFTVQIQDPRISRTHFNLVAVPAHDPARGDNVIVTDGAPNLMTPDKLAAAKENFAPLFSPLPFPRVAVLIGGNSKAHRMTPDIILNLCKQLNELNAGLMITASRRTGEDNLALLKQHIRPPHFLWDGTGDNPYFGMLAWADHILVTEDSVSMVSDAGTTGKPVQIIALNGGKARLGRFHEHMRARGVTRPFDGKLESWTYPRLNDAETVAAAIYQRLGALRTGP